jgi:hypothetical protein
MGSVEKLTIVEVRPWKLPSATNDRGLPVGHTLDLASPTGALP